MRSWRGCANSKWGISCIEINCLHCIRNAPLMHSKERTVIRQIVRRVSVRFHSKAEMQRTKSTLSPSSSVVGDESMCTVYRSTGACCCFHTYTLQHGWDIMLKAAASISNIGSNMFVELWMKGVNLNWFWLKCDWSYLITGNDVPLDDCPLKKGCFFPYDVQGFSGQINLHHSLGTK
jgi:hypothetical protein